MNDLFSKALAELSPYDVVIPNDTVEYTKACLCTVMSEEFLRKILTGRTVDYLLAYRAEEVRKEEAKIPDGRMVRLEYDLTLIPGNTKAYREDPQVRVITDVKELEVEVRIFDIEEKAMPPDPTDDKFVSEEEKEQEEGYEGRGAYYIFGLDEAGGITQSRKNLNINLKFVFDPKRKVLRRVELGGKFVVNAQLITKIDARTWICLREAEEPQNP